MIRHRPAPPAFFLAADVVATAPRSLAAYLIRFESVWPTPKGPQPFGTTRRSSRSSRSSGRSSSISTGFTSSGATGRSWTRRSPRLAVSLSTLLSSASSPSGGPSLQPAAPRPLPLPRRPARLPRAFAIRRYLGVWARGRRSARARGGRRHAGRALAEKLLDHPEAGISRSASPTTPRQAARRAPRPPRPRDDRGGPELIERHDIDTVFLALPVEAHHTMLGS